MQCDNGAHVVYPRPSSMKAGNGRIVNDFPTLLFKILFFFVPVDATTRLGLSIHKPTSLMHVISHSLALQRSIHILIPVYLDLITHAVSVKL